MTLLETPILDQSKGLCKNLWRFEKKQRMHIIMLVQHSAFTCISCPLNRLQKRELVTQLCGLGKCGIVSYRVGLRPESPDIVEYSSDLDESALISIWTRKHQRSPGLLCRARQWQTTSACLLPWKNFQVVVSWLWLNGIFHHCCSKEIGRSYNVHPDHSSFRLFWIILPQNLPDITHQWVFFLLFLQ